MQTTIYIRKENEDYWNSLNDKSEHVNFWISEDREDAKTVKKHIVEEGKKLGILKPENDLQAAKGLGQSPGMCKTHGTPLTAAGKCLQKGCKYA